MNEKRRKPKFNFNPKPFKPQPYRTTQRAPFAPFRAQPQTRPVKSEQEEKYWTAEQWEDWAREQYNNNEDAVDFLPEWFIEQMEEE